jgi:flagella basal body P-ring formation protein FlgA
MKPSDSNFGKNQRIWCGFFFLSAALVLAGITAEISAAGSTRVQISESVAIDDEEILLGRIADIQGDDPLLVDKLGTTVLGRLPLPGQRRELEAGFLKMRLKQNGCDLSELVLLLPPKVVVTRNFVEISKEKMETIVSNFILQNLSDTKGDAEIKDIQVPESLRLPKGDIRYKVIPTRNSEMMGKMLLSIDFDVDGKFQKSVWATATIEVLTDVVVTTKPLARLKPISEDDISMQKMDLANLPSDVITDPEAILGKRTKRAIGKQTALRAEHLELPPLVNRGDMVVIIAESEGLRITARGQVKKRGRLGERVPVINFDSKKVLYALVIDAHTVKVEF